MLLVQGIQRRGREFQGDMKILVNGEQDGKKVVIQLPQNAAEVAAYRLSFKYYQSVERVFRIPAEVHIDSVEIRVFEKGMQEPKAKQTVLLS
jgi:ribosomal protein L14E/L6E/L27E